MEMLTEAVKRFLDFDQGYGSGYGSGGGGDSGGGYGYGEGYRYREGYGYGEGYGEGSGGGSRGVDGSGRGCSQGAGYGSGGGDCYARGCGEGLLSFDGKPVHWIDNVPTVILHVKGNLAKGFIVNRDLTPERCYIAKSGNQFAHGKTIKETQEALQAKIFNNMDTDEKIDAFMREFKPGAKYPAKLFYEWHNKLTGSCEFGRNAFVRNHGIDLENGMYTPEEFVEITKDDFGGDIIKQIKERIESL